MLVLALHITAGYGSADVPLAVPHEIHNLVVVLAVLLLLTLVYRVCIYGQHCQDLAAALYSSQLVRIDGLCHDFHGHPICVKQFRSLLRARQRAEPMPVQDIVALADVHTRTVKLSAPQEPLSVTFSLDTSKPCWVQVFWGVSAAVLQRLVRPSVLRTRKSYRIKAMTSPVAAAASTPAAGTKLDRLDRKLAPRTVSREESSVLEMSTPGYSASALWGPDADEGSEFVARSRPVHLATPGKQHELTLGPGTVCNAATGLDVLRATGTRTSVFCLILVSSDDAFPLMNQDEALDAGAKHADTTVGVSESALFCSVLTSERKAPSQAPADAADSAGTPGPDTDSGADGVGAREGVESEQPPSEGVELVPVTPAGDGAQALPRVQYSSLTFKRLLQHGASVYRLHAIYEPGNTLDDDSAPECTLCLCDPPSTVLLPCRHFCVCDECFERLRQENPKCPICRQGITASLHVPQDQDDDGVGGGGRGDTGGPPSRVEVRSPVPTPVAEPTLAAASLAVVPSLDDVATPPSPDARSDAIGDGDGDGDNHDSDGTDAAIDARPAPSPRQVASSADAAASAAAGSNDLDDDDDDEPDQDVMADRDPLPPL